MATMHAPHLWAGKPIDALQRQGGLWVHSLGRDLRAADSIVSYRQEAVSLLCYLHEGHGDICIDGRTFPISAGDLVYYPAGARIAQHPAADGTWDWYWVVLEGPLVTALSADFGWSAERQPLHIGRRTQFLPLYEEMLAAMYEEPYGRFIVNALAYQLLAQLGQLTCGARHTLPHLGADAPVMTIIAYLGRHLHEHLTLEVLAENAAVSPQHLVKQFRQATGIPPMQYLNHLRIDRAKALLLSTSRTIPEIADATGISDVNYFYRLFKRTVGCTPKKYRDTGGEG